MAKTLILPGLDGSPAPHWQHWWAATDPSAIMVEQSDWHSPNPRAWETEAAGQILHHPGCILVGHSLGAVLATRLLTRWPQLNIAAALLVAPADTQLSDRISDFGPLTRAPLQVPSILVASQNDPWMSYASARGHAENWGSELVDLGMAGHINVASGFGPWPGGKLLRDRLLARAWHADRPCAPPAKTAHRAQA